MDRIRQIALDWWDSITAFLVGTILLADSILSAMRSYGFIDNNATRYLVLALFCALGVVATFRARVSLNQYKKTLPKIVVSQPPTWELKSFSNGFRYALSIEFKNEASHPSEASAARHVSATVRWRNPRGNLVAENHGRWHITNRQKALGHNMQTVDIYPNDQEVKLQLAIKSKDGKALYAWHRAKDEADVQTELHNRFYNVEIVLADSRGLRWTFEYLIENKEMPEAPDKKHPVAP